MRIRKPITLYLVCISIVIMLAGLIAVGCKGKETEQAVPAGSEQQREAAETAGSGPAGQPVESPDETTVRNTPPRITIFNIEPKTPVVGDTIRATIETFDREGDEVSVTVAWMKNDVPLPNEAAALPLTREFQRGDKIAVKAVPDDGKVKGSPLTVVVYIANASPVVKAAQEPFSLAGGLYTYQVKATDPDGDELTYMLKEAPSGMTIDPKKGLIQWNVPPGFTGTSTHTVSVTDGRGGETTGTFTIEITSRTAG
ncbi:MAG: putative Ig domain-containing protein [Nitrospirota bacterium]